jgi:protein phosphatase
MIFKTMKFQCWCLTDKGLKRAGNQDSFLIDERLGIFVVADGVGGHMGGEVASALAVETVREVMGHPKANDFQPKQVLMQAYEEASHRIFDRATQETRLNGMGTTMVMGYIRNSHLYIANVGDSRAYLFRKPYVWQLTEDHSLINEQVRLGLLTEEQAHKVIGKNVITRSVGFERDVFPDVIEREISEGDVYIFCSDGLSGMITDEKILQIMSDNPVEKTAEILIQQALEHGGEDNVTVLVLSF